ncbi:mandelate racemase/muconate lactonizing enzyme family protein [Mycolicibacterium agri]|uniref:Mandelate racemase n=2 Tax=Mycolicibacterium agri TaxID=36811 RepID=A0A7I9VT27_MYCAG|nr:mandelate racemase/muconate lactonizing enzyme family protein [Mycolicibacterium agri]GFG48595.1 mandelate racemase [Mycolicibacterium agri]
MDSANAMPATIEKIETIPLRVPLGRVYRGSYYSMSHRSTIITRIHLSNGVVGEAFVGDEDDTNAAIERVIHTEVLPKIQGEDGLRIQRIWELMRPVTFNILRDRRIGLVAMACVDTALWDAIGKTYGQPLWRLWGGYRNTIPMIWTGGYYDEPGGIDAELKRARDAGVHGMKFKVGALSPEEDAERFRAARKAAGDDFVLIADANQGWSPDQAVRFAQLVSDFDLYYFEEPVRWDNDHRGMRDVRFRSGARICAGQSEFSAGGCRDLMVAGAIDFCNFDGSWSGGPTEWLRVAAIAKTFDVTMSHHEEAHIGAHLLAAIPNGTFADTMHVDRDPIWHNLIANRPALEDGILQLSERPGLGWELDEDYIEKYRVNFDENGLIR